MNNICNVCIQEYPHPPPFFFHFIFCNFFSCCCCWYHLWHHIERVIINGVRNRKRDPVVEIIVITHIKQERQYRLMLVANFCLEHIPKHLTTTAFNTKRSNHHHHHRYHRHSHRWDRNIIIGFWFHSHIVYVTHTICVLPYTQ